MRLRTLLVVVCWSTLAVAQVTPSAQTPLIPSTAVGDLAIFPNPLNPDESRLIGTDRLQNGLFSFRLDGGVGEYLTLGPMRGVDVKTGVRFQAAPSAVLAAASASAGVFVYSLGDAGQLLDVRARSINVPGVGALALWSPPDGGLEAWLDVGTTTLRRIAFFEAENDAERFDWVELPNTVTLPRVVSSLLVDSRSGQLYASVASDGIYGWRIDSLEAPRLLEGIDGGSLNGVPAGLGLYPLRDGGAVMIVSIIGRDEYAAYEVTDTTFTALTRFQLGYGPVLVRNSHYVDVSQAPLPGFPSGVLAVSDHNSSTGANYKLIRWDTLAAATDPPLPDESDGGQAADGGGPACLDDGGLPDAGRHCLADAGPPPVGGGFGGGGVIGGGDGGGAGAGGGGGGGDTVKPPRSCCSGGAMSAIVPGGVVLLWTLSRRRRKT